MRRAYGLSSLSKETRKSNRLQMYLQKQHILLGNLKTLNVGLGGELNKWPPAQRTCAYPVELIGRWLIVKVNSRTRECEKLFFSANRVLTLVGNIIISRATSLTTSIKLGGIIIRPNMQNN